MRLIIFICFLFNCYVAKAQYTCDSAYQYCGGTYEIPITTNVPDMGTYDCLLTATNPTWFYFQISVAGDLLFQVTGTNTTGSAIDVDVAVSGPFTYLDCGWIENSLSDNVVFCDYSTSNIIEISIPNTAIGEYYYLTVTNFSNEPGTINFDTLTSIAQVYSNCNTSIEDVNNSANSIILLNPVSESLYMKNLPKEEYEIIIFDLMGQRISGLQENQSELNYDVSSLPAGTYIVSVILGNGSSQTKSFIKF